VLAKRDLDRIKQLDQQQDEQDLVEQPGDVGHEGPGERALAEVDQCRGEQHQDDSREQQPEADVDDVLDIDEPASDSGACRRPFIRL
jgi:hypothetical protein